MIRSTKVHFLLR